MRVLDVAFSAGGNTPLSTTHAYRPDIDGLRAIAVMSVMLFHAGFDVFRGGFVGVDVFFVISGYLITGIILGELAAGKFSIVRFYERRARRLLPALFVVAAVSALVAWTILYPVDLRHFGNSLTSVSLFLSNVFFWRTTGYFGGVAELKPLLHTWSLAVEEQFYLFFPPALILLWRGGRAWIGAALAVAVALSLGLAHWAATAYPGAAFFLLPTRLWEMAAGSLVAFYARNHGEVRSEWGASVGLVLILGSIFLFHGDMPWPSLYTVAPVLGTALIILCGNGGTLTGRLLSLRPMVGIGLISYSAYLWHQPIFAFARHLALGEMGAWMQSLLVGLTLALAWVSWKYVEQPFRGQAVNRKQIFAVSGVGLVSMAALGMAIPLHSPSFTREQAAIYQFAEYDFSRTTGVDCFLELRQAFTSYPEVCNGDSGSPRVVIWGDSHAAAMSGGLRHVYPNVAQYTMSACAPIAEVTFLQSKQCRAANDQTLERFEELKPETVILHARWPHYTDKFDQLPNTIATIREQSPQTHIVILGNVPEWKVPLPELLLRTKAPLAPDLYVETPHIDELRAIDLQLQEIASQNNVTFISPLDSMCRGHECLATVDGEHGRELTVWDYDHLTKAGAVYVANAIITPVSPGNTSGAARPQPTPAVDHGANLH